MVKHEPNDDGKTDQVSISVADTPDKLYLNTEPENELQRNIDTEKDAFNHLGSKLEHLNQAFVEDEPTANSKTNGGEVINLTPRGSKDDRSVASKEEDRCSGSNNEEQSEMNIRDQDVVENVVSRALTFVEKSVASFYKRHRTIIKSVVGFCIFVLYNVYLGFAIHLKWNVTRNWCEGVKFLVLLTALVYFLIVYYVVVKPYIFNPAAKALARKKEQVSRVINHGLFSRVSWCVVAIIIASFLIYDSRENKSRLVSAGGLIIILAFGYVFSAHPRKIIWRHVLWGLLLQFILGLVVLRWKVGQDFFECLGNKTKSFLNFTDNGSAFVFGYLVTGKLQGLPDQLPVFAFKVLSTVIFFSFVISILYYYGIMQVLVMKVGWILQATIGTTACESTNAAANIFLGMTEAPLMIKPYLALMTKSELHAVMTGGFATVAGSVLAAYINFGVNPSHLLSASVMSAPAALGYAKLFYPETEVSRTKSEDIAVERGSERNAIEAAANGAATAVSLVANIAANLIAFLAGIHFLNSNLSWFGSLVGWEFLTFEWLLSQIFRPLAFIMGVPWIECENVGKLIGLKTIVNEFVAYQELAFMQKHGELSPRSEAISVFALCGFSNIGSIGIMLGGLTTLAPSRKSDLAKVAVRAMIAGSAACFTTACIAGALLDETFRKTITEEHMQILPVT